MDQQGIERSVTLHLNAEGHVETIKMIDGLNQLFTVGYNASGTLYGVGNGERFTEQDRYYCLALFKLVKEHKATMRAFPSIIGEYTEQQYQEALAMIQQVPTV